MRKLLFFLMIFSFYATVSSQTIAPKGTIHFFVGTYTEENGSEGIYSYGLDPVSGKLHSNGLAVLSENPSYLTMTTDGKHLISVREMLDENNLKMGYIELFNVEGTGNLTSVNKVPSGGANPCHVAVNGEGDVVASNYTGGSVALFKILPSGEMSEALSVSQHTGSGPVLSRQEKPHVHSSLFEPDGKRIFVADLGTDRVKVYTIDKNTNTLKPYKYPEIIIAPGSGPRHMVIHPNGKLLYVANEMGCSVSVVELAAKGSFKVLETVSTLPPEYKIPNTCADIHLSADGRFLYVSNRGMNSIAIFSVQDTKIRLIGHEDTRGETPRNFTLSPDGEYLLVANQNSNNIVAFKRNAETGLLTFTDEIAAFKPVCLLFSKLP
jgi:6-phosphogluconolactonase